MSRLVLMGTSTCQLEDGRTASSVLVELEDAEPFGLLDVPYYDRTQQVGGHDVHGHHALVAPERVEG